MTTPGRAPNGAGRTPPPSVPIVVIVIGVILLLVGLGQVLLQLVSSRGADGGLIVVGALQTIGGVAIVIIGVRMRTRR